MGKIRIKDPYDFMKGLKRDGLTFQIHKTLYTMDIICDYGEFKWVSPESEIPRNELFFVKMVSDAVKKMNIQEMEHINTRDIKYFDLSGVNGDFLNCYEVDISGAYWAMAKQFIPDNVYQRGLTVSKKTRLAALGALAKTTTDMYFDGKTFVNTCTHTETTRDLFFYCALKVGEIMNMLRIMCGYSLFYWVDAIFTKNEKDVQYIFAALQNLGLDGKQFLCERITADDNKILVYSMEHYNDEIQKGKKGRLVRTFHKERLSSNHFIGRFKEYLFNEIKN